MAVAIMSFGKILASGILIVSTTAFAPAPKPIPVADNSLCVDSMETVPDDDDDLDAMPIVDKMDVGCQLPSEPVSV